MFGLLDTSSPHRDIYRAPVYFGHLEHDKPLGFFDTSKFFGKPKMVSMLTKLDLGGHTMP